MAQTIRFRGETYPVIDCFHLGRRDYLVLKSLSGGLRERYKAYDPVARDLRAVLVLPRSASSSRHLKNLKHLANRNSANFPMILEFHPRDDQVFVIQAWVWGHDLARKLEHAARHPDSWPHPAECFQIYRRLAHALTQIHRETGLVHGDVKPSNIVLVRNRVFLVDFGNAWTPEQSAHRPPGDGISGAYASPEQHRAEPFVDQTSDSFSASVIAYQLLTRQLPYDGLGGKVPAAADSSDPEIPLRAASQLSPYRFLMRDEFWRRIDQILARGLAFQQKNRFVNGDAWLSEIESLNAMLKLQTKLPPWKESLLNTFDWFAGWFRRR
jgi:serine/threonine-protein kinase